MLAHFLQESPDTHFHSTKMASIDHFKASLLDFVEMHGLRHLPRVLRRQKCPRPQDSDELARQIHLAWYSSPSYQTKLVRCKDVDLSYGVDHLPDLRLNQSEALNC